MKYILMMSLILTPMSFAEISYREENILRQEINFYTSDVEKAFEEYEGASFRRFSLRRLTDRLKKRTHRFFQPSRRYEPGARIGELILEKILEHHRFSDQIMSEDDFLDKIKEAIAKILANKYVRIIIKVMGQEEFKSAVEGIYNNYVAFMKNPDQCDEEITDWFGDISFVVTYLIIFYETQLPPLCFATATVAERAVKLTVDLGSLDSRLCDRIHGGRYYVGVK